VQDKQTKKPFSSERKIAYRITLMGLLEEYGVFVYPGTGSGDGIDGDHIIIAPPYNITEDDVHLIVRLVTKLIRDFFENEARCN